MIYYEQHGGYAIQQIKDGIGFRFKLGVVMDRISINTGFHLLKTACVSERRYEVNYSPFFEGDYDTFDFDLSSVFVQVGFIF